MLIVRGNIAGTKSSPIKNDINAKSIIILVFCSLVIFSFNGFIDEII